MGHLERRAEERCGAPNVPVEHAQGYEVSRGLWAGARKDSACKGAVSVCLDRVDGAFAGARDYSGSYGLGTLVLILLI